MFLKSIKIALLALIIFGVLSKNNSVFISSMICYLPFLIKDFRENHDIAFDDDDGCNKV